MPLKIITGDITKVQCDAIVNAANNTLLGGGGVDGAIHAAAGPELLKECRTLGGCATGDAKITSSYRLPARYVIHTVGPVWHGGNNGEKKLLISCYKKSLKLAKDNDCKSIAFPLISAGVYGYPKADAYAVARDTIMEFLKENDMTVYLVIYRSYFKVVSDELYKKIEVFIAQHSLYANNTADDIPSKESIAMCSNCCPPLYEHFGYITMESHTEENDFFRNISADLLTNDPNDESMLIYSANINKETIVKLKNKDVTPSRQLILAICIALNMDIEQTDKILDRSGYKELSNNKADIIIRYFIENKISDIIQLNETLFSFGEKPL